MDYRNRVEIRRRELRNGIITDLLRLSHECDGESFSAAIREVLDLKFMTQVELATYCCVNQSTICRWAEGKGKTNSLLMRTILQRVAERLAAEEDW